MAAIASKLPQNLVKNRYRDISACEYVCTVMYVVFLKYLCIQMYSRFCMKM